MVFNHTQSASAVLYKKGSLLFAYNLHVEKSIDGCFIPVGQPGRYRAMMSTDDYCYGGEGRIFHQTYEAVKNEAGQWGVRLYLPSRTAVVLMKEK